MEICVKEIYNELNQTNLDSVYEFAKERELPLLQKACEHYIVINQVPNYDSPELELQVQQNTRVCYDNHEYTTSQSNRSFDLVKTIIFGDQECGKTTLWNRLLEQPHRVEYKATIGVDFGAIIWRLPYDNLVNTQIWDTAGVPRFRVITESFFNTSFKIAAVCFAFDRYASFEYAKDVLLGKRLKDYIEQGRKVLLVGLKHDTKHVVRRSEALE
jgi:small GTP-binding protein